MKEHVVELLKQQLSKLCVLSTATKDGKPESAVVGYAVKDDLTLYFSTHTNTRKYKNIVENPKASFVTGWTFNTSNIQIDGTARIISEEHSEYKAIEEFFFTQNPEAAKFKSPGIIFIELTPTWAHLLDLSVHPPMSEEITNF